MLNISAITGPGNLLGNLLCALVSLLDGGLIGNTEVDRLVDAINTAIIPKKSVFTPSYVSKK